METNSNYTQKIMNLQSKQMMTITIIECKWISNMTAGQDQRSYKSNNDDVLVVLNVRWAKAGQLSQLGEYKSR